MKNGLRKSIREKLKKKSLRKLFLTRKKTCSFGSSMLNTKSTGNGLILSKFKQIN